MPSRFLMELGYNPYGSVGGEGSAGYGVGSVGYGVGSAGFRDRDGDGFKDFDEGDFGDFDPFPEDVPVYE